MSVTPLEEKATRLLVHSKAVRRKTQLYEHAHTYIIVSFTYVIAYDEVSVLYLPLNSRLGLKCQIVSNAIGVL